MGLLLLVVGDKGNCIVLLNLCVMVYQLFGGYCGVVFDIECYVEEIIDLKKCLNDIYVKYIGQNYVIIEKKFDCDMFMMVEEVKEFGIIDIVYECCSDVGEE